ncbi:MATE family efflux transporter [Anaeromicrobium sediminis]|uniref:MATE family efflux transporter n=1 Tax=Anaeromicrobium sediminis TaxID=1478221 RepID=A0A267MKG9_9FIRM|nr:MATE family efflux transporter [Anaeromicrobium sediminis]PAB60101.1 hypothetical protein CCE28_06930 [Anaeromicrobium sediminis]
MNLPQKGHVDLGNDKISKIFWHYAIPSILAMLAQSTAGLVDSAFIGRYVGSKGLSAITLIMPFVMLLAGIAIMVAIGGTTLAGIHKGKEELEKSNNYFNVTIVLLSMIAVAATIILIGLSSKFPNLLGAEEKIAEYMIDYIRTLSLFLLPFILTFAFSFFLKLDGKPVVVVLAVLIGTVINISLDYLLVGVLGWEMKGAALATGMSQLIPWLLMLYMIKYKSSWKFSVPIFRKKEIWSMLFNGSSELLSMAAASIAGFIYNVIIIKKIGMEGVAAYAVALQITTISTSVFYGFAEAIQSAVSFNLGAHKLERVKKLRSMSIYANLASGVVLCVASLMLGESMASIFIKEKGTIQIAAYILDFYAFAFILSGVNITLGTYYTAVNSPILSAVITASRSLIGLIIGLIILPLIFGNEGIWMAVIFAEVATIIVGIVCMRKYPFGDLKENLID